MASPHTNQSREAHFTNSCQVCNNTLLQSNQLRKHQAVQLSMQEDSKPNKSQSKMLPLLHMKTLAILLLLLTSLLLFSTLQPALNTGTETSAEQAANQN